MKNTSILCLSVFVTLAWGQQPESKDVSQTPASDSQSAAKDKTTVFKPEELEQLAAPVALYPDALLSQIFMASTYPLEIVYAARWSKEHPDVKGDAVVKEMEKQNWDANVKSLVAFPEVLAMMYEKLDWTQKLGDAFLAQRKELMDAVQRLRKRAKDSGNLKSGKEQTVKTEAAPAESENPQVIVIESSDPQVVYVPTYNPTVVYGAWPYPAYPPYYYYPPGYVAGTAFFSFSMGVMVGGAMWGGFNWGYGDVDINVNRYNNFNRTNVGVNRNITSNRWQHDPAHRRGVGYRDSATQQQYGRGSSQGGIQAREEFRGYGDQARQSGSFGEGQARDAGASSRTGTGDFGGSQSRDAARAQGSGGGSMSRDTSMSSRSKSTGAFEGVGSGASARASSSRGSFSRGGGMSRGGGRR